ncbi:MAG TPA: glutamine-hydrolyzing carbamoyl-phosphate synthase small subunit [Myxococcota bacterium]|nr:glutamine-hydrolyzing carbamoyl-phosphate synthase small subunit [Myxococcota bacterium]
MRAVLLLEDGRRFEGRGFGARVTRVGEAVFNTAMTGYQEILTDPSYAEQVVCMTSSHIGNTGINGEDLEAAQIRASGFIVRSLSPRPSNWRSTGDLDGWLAAQGVPGLAGVDTRTLTAHLRTHGAQRCAISTEELGDDALRAAIDAWPGMVGRALAAEVGCREPWVYADPAESTWRVAVLDGGAKANILRLLAATGAYVRVHPIDDPPEAFTAGVDAVFVANGPGDPAALPVTIRHLAQVVGRVPCLGICLGHQLLALALGAGTYKLKFGHRGANQPVRDERTGRVEITSQNHGFAVNADDLRALGAEITHTHLNDGTVSGFWHPARRVFAVQYHPESNPGPHDSRHLFQQFKAFALGEGS